MKKDIADRSDIHLLMNLFYSKVRQDQTVGYIFNDVAKVNWEHHIPIICDFWENLLFQTGNYNGNPITVHMKLHTVENLTKAHFDKWLLLFTSTVDELFDGLNAELAKQRALSIATIMQLRIHKPPTSFT